MLPIFLVHIEQWMGGKMTSDFSSAFPESSTRWWQSTCAYVSHPQHDKSQVIVLLNPVHRTYAHLKYKGDGMSIAMKSTEIFTAYLLWGGMGKRERHGCKIQAMSALEGLSCLGSSDLLWQTIEPNLQCKGLPMESSYPRRTISQEGTQDGHPQRPTRKHHDPKSTVGSHGGC